MVENLGWSVSRSAYGPRSSLRPHRHMHALTYACWLRASQKACRGGRPYGITRPPVPARCNYDATLKMLPCTGGSSSGASLNCTVANGGTMWLAVAKSAGTTIAMVYRRFITDMENFSAAKNLVHTEDLECAGTHASAPKVVRLAGWQDSGNLGPRMAKLDVDARIPATLTSQE